MSTTANHGRKGSSYATLPVRWFSNKITGFVRNRYQEGGLKGAAAGLFIAFVVYWMSASMALGVVLYAIGAVLGVTLNVMLVSLAAVVAAVGTVWSGYRAHRQLNDRERAYRLSEQGNAKAGGEALEILNSGDSMARTYASLAVAEAGRGSAGGVLKQSSVTASQAVARLVALLEDSSPDTRLNSMAAIETFAIDFPNEVQKYDEQVTEAAKRPETDVQCCAVRTLGILAKHRDVESDRTTAYLDPIGVAVTDDDHRVREDACLALGHIDDERAVDLLEKLSDDPRQSVREKANDALSRRRDQRSASGRSSEGDDESDGNDMIQSPPEIDFSDMAGMDELKGTLRDRVIDPFSGEGAYDTLDVGFESGILLHGPPGTGKTYTARCLAGELGINYLPAGIGSVESKFVGEGVENITEIFDQAHRNQPCLVFLDEFDALAGDRDDGTQQSDAQKQVNQLLQEMSDIGGDDEILVVAATNNPDAIDDAMLRTGRFDSKIEVPPPDAEARLEIFAHHLGAPINRDVDVDIDAEIQRRTNGCTASDMERIANQATRHAAKRQSNAPDGLATDGGQASGHESMDGDVPVIQWADIEQAIEEVVSEQSSVGQFVQQAPDTSFDDVAGMDPLKTELREKVIEPLDDPEMFEEFGVSVERGFIFYGPPGTGKTHMARCLAGELDVSYIQADAGDLTSKWIGEGAGNVQQMFEEARKNQPTLMFIDEIDALATDRGMGNQQKSERQMVNQFLDEISSLHEGDDDVIVIGATNRINDVDDAIVRGGRLGEKIEVGLPDVKARKLIFEHHLDAPSEDLDLNRIAALTEGFVASDMERLAETAARNALRKTRESGERTPVSQSDVEDAIEHIKSRQ